MRRNTSSRHQSRYERTQTVTGKQWGIVVTIFLIIISVIGFVAYKKFQGKVEYDKVTACPMVNGVVKPAKQTVVVIDETDVLSPHQRDYLKVHLSNFVKDEMVSGELLSVYILDSEITKKRKPIFEMCKMRDGSDANDWTENQKLMARRFKKQFQGPLMSRLDATLARSTSSESSPIFETLQTIAVNAFDKYNIDGERRMLVFSDMLHHTPEYSMFTVKRSFETFKKSDYYAQIKTFLPDTAVRLYVLNTYPKYQKQELMDFWKSYFKSASAYVEQVSPVGR